LSASGLGHQAIAWTLRRLGFTRSTGIRPGDTVQLGQTRLRTTPSRVPFPEMGLLVEGRDATVVLCGGPMLHPSTQQRVAGPNVPGVDVAVIPTHSIAPPGVLTQRRQVNAPEELAARAVGNFDRWAATVNAGLTIPSSFGWRVHGGFSWCNSALFPLTPWQA